MSEDLDRNLPAALDRLARRAPTASIDPAPIRRRAVRRRRRMIAAPVAIGMVVAAAVTGVTLSRPQSTVVADPASDSACGPLQTDAPLDWATAGFTGKAYPPFAQSRSGDVIAFVFGDPLAAPPASDHQNKVLRVVRGGTTGDIAITARLEGSQTLTTLQVPAGPSYVDMPSAGCWELDLHMGDRHDSINLRWTQP